MKLVKVSINVHSDEIENNHQEAQIKCQKSINQVLIIISNVKYIPLQL